MAVSCADYREIKLSLNIKENLLIFKNIFKKDAILRSKTLLSNGREYAVLYMDGMVNVAMLNDSVVRPIVMLRKKPNESCLADSVLSEILFASEAKKPQAWMRRFVLCCMAIPYCL